MTMMVDTEEPRGSDEGDPTGVLHCWHAAMDPADHETLYFFDSISGATTYDAPHGFYETEASNWIVYHADDGSGNVFYVHRKSGEKTWKKPACLESPTRALDSQGTILDTPALSPSSSVASAVLPPTIAPPRSARTRRESSIGIMKGSIAPPARH